MTIKQFRKILIYALCLLVFVLFAACSTEAETDGYANDLEANETIAEENDRGYTTMPDIVQMPFNGDAIPRTGFFWQEERDLNWESDVRHFGVKALRQHPLLIDFDLSSPRLAYGIVREDYSAGVNAYNMLLRRAAARNGIPVSDSIDEMQEAFRELIIQRINELILDIPNLNDNEILFGLAAIATLFDDAHTRMGLPTGDIFPIELISLSDGIYFIGVPKEVERALYGELIAINGIDIDEIIERFAEIIAHENEYYLRHKITSPAEEDPIRLRHYVVRPFLKEFIALNYLSVVDDSGAADFTIRGASGETFDIQLRAIDRETLMDESSFVRHEFNTFMHRNIEEVFWHEYFPEENLMYVRITGFQYAESGNIAAARSVLMTELENWPASEKIESFIIDLRQNPGGVFEWPADSEFDVLAEVAESLYVIIDAGTFSMGVINTSNIMNYMENAIIIGEPSGQTDNFFGSDGGTLPNSRMRYNISHRMWVGSSSEDTAIRPDIFVPLTISDIINNIDPVIEAIKTQ